MPTTYDRPGNEPDSKPARKKGEESELNSLGSSAPASDSQSPERAAGLESSALGNHENQIGPGFRKSKDKPGFLGWFGRNKKTTVIGGGVGATLITGALLLFTYFAGPAQFIHFAQLLQKFHFSNNESFSDGRSSRAIIYTILGQGNRARLGVVNNRLADKWEARLIKETGLRPVYTKGANRFAGFEIVDSEKARPYIEEAKNRGINTGATDKNVVNRNAGETGKFIDYRDDKFRSRRGVIRTVGKGTGTAKITSAIGSRLLIKRGGVDFHPLKNIKRQAGDSLIKYYQKVKDERAERDKSGVPQNTVELSPDDEDNDGDKNPDGTAADKEAAEKANEIINSAKDANAKGAEGSKTIKSLKAGLGKSATPVVAVGALCTVKSFSKDIVDQQHKIIIMPMMRMAFRLIATGNQVMSGQDVNMDELGSIADDLNDSDEDGKGPDTGSSWGQAKSIQAELGQAQTGPDLPIEAKPSRVGEKPDIVKAVDGIPGLDTTCGIFSKVSGLPIIKQASDLAAKLAIGAADLPLKALGTSVNELISSAISLAAGQGVNPYAQGAELGNIANYGARLAANDQALAMGGRELNPEEVAVLDRQSKQYRNYEYSQRSFAQKYLDPYDADSAVAKAIDKTPGSFTELSSAIFNPSRVVSGFFSSLGSLIPSANAAESANYDYGFDEFGFSAEEQADERFENPYDNAVIVEPRLEELNDKYGDCFATKIIPGPSDSQTLLIESGESINYATRNKDKCNDGSDDLLRYRFYLADTVTAHSLACYEGGEESCSQLGFSAGSSTEATPASAAGATIDTENLYKDSSGVACAPPTRDLGIQDGYSDGTLVKVRICAVPNLPSTGNESNSGYGVIGGNGQAIVNSRISGAVYALMEDAKKSGNLQRGAASSFRTMSHQQALCANNSLCSSGNYKLVAKPGTSNHQLGIAIDFYINNLGISSSQCIYIGGRCTAKGHSDWEWLENNAAKYGLKPYVNEFWHWSPTGS